MKKQILIIASLLLVGCENKNYEQRHTNIVVDGSNLIVFTIDSCEYIGSTIYNISHKGNCKFCLKRGYSIKNGVYFDQRSTNKIP